MFKKRGTPRAAGGFLSQHHFLTASSMLTGTVIGAGILGIPYVVAKAGFWYGAILIFLLGLAYLFLHLSLGEIVIRTKKQYQLTGYAGKYLGPLGKKIMTLSLFITLHGALIAYLIGEGATLHFLFKIGSPLMYSLLFFLIASFIVSRGIKTTGRTELLLTIVLVIVVLFIGLFSLENINTAELTFFHPLFFFLPYGVILFAFHGTPAIPEMQEELGKNKKHLRKAILLGSSIPIVVYLLFSFVIVGIVGLENFEKLAPNERIATIALSIYSSTLLGYLANILAMLSMFTSYLTISLALREIYEYDYNLSRRTAFILTSLIPLLIVLFNVTSFITIIMITGAFIGGLEGSLIILMFWKAKKNGDRIPEYSLKFPYFLGLILLLLFVLGIIYQFWDFFF
ncbi:amino acid permease [Candidatus Woesearchaeota archaeon]|nr:amino acid permease [Candidatus Woesearchaeota archaeon]